MNKTTIINPWVFLITVSIAVAGCTPIKRYFIRAGLRSVPKISEKAINRVDKSGDENGKAIKFSNPYTYPSDIKVVPVSGNSDSRMLGILNHLDGIKVGEALSIIMVHGMGTKSESDYDEAVKLYDANLAFSLQKVKGTYEIIGDAAWTLEVLAGDNRPPHVKSFLRKVTHSDGSIKWINFLFSHWSPATQGYKLMVDSLDSIEPDVDYAKFNRFAKESVVVDGLGDVVALMETRNRRKAHRTLEACMLMRSLKIEKLVELIEAAESGDQNLVPQELVLEPANTNTVFLSGSLGTKLTLEFLASYQNVLDSDRFIGVDDEHKDRVVLYPSVSLDTISSVIFDWESTSTRLIVQEFMTDTFSWVGMSNQLPLLSAIDYSIDYLDIATFTELSLLDRRNTVRSLLSRSRFVSFYDPNDILGFRARSLYHDPSIIPLSTILIRLPVDPAQNLETVNPLTAHSGIKDNLYFAHIFVNGWGLVSDSLPATENLVTIDKPFSNDGWIQKLLKVE